MHPIIADKLRATLPLPDNDVPCLRVLVPSLDTGVFELSPAQYQAMVCAILNTPADDDQLPLFKVAADEEVLTVPAYNIFHAFKIVRTLRPQVITVSDTAGD